MGHSTRRERRRLLSAVLLAILAGTGGATGNGVTIEANDSCGTWLGPVSESPVGGSVALRRETRRVTSWPPIGQLVTLAILTLAALFALRRLTGATAVVTRLHDV